MPYFVANLQNHKGMVFKYAEREDAESMVNMLNDMGMEEWLVLVSPLKPDL